MRINIVNKDMELNHIKDKWTYHEKYHIWMLEDILYTPNAKVPAFQRLSIFVPGKYMSAPGVIDENATENGYTAKTAPVVFENNSAGYMQMPHTWIDGPRSYALKYLDAGMIYVTCGNRGHESHTKEDGYVGKSPINLVDLKTAVRFIRHNRNAIPGDVDKMISVGWSAGGAMSTLLGVTGDNEKYLPYLEENGAFMDESDHVYAAQIYCPIIDLEHADIAYEWMFFADQVSEPSFAGPGGEMTEFEKAISKQLYRDYIKYFNGLKVKNPKTHEVLTIGEDGRSGSAYDYLMEQISKSATKFLNKLANKELEDRDYSVEAYLSGEYTFEKPKPMGPPPAMQSFAGPDVELSPEKPSDEDELGFGLGTMMLRPEEGEEKRDTFAPEMMTVQGTKKSSWLSYENGVATVRDLDAYVLNQRRRMKGCPSFDILSNTSGENKVFGNQTTNAVHFSQQVKEAIAQLKDSFPKEYQMYYDSYAKDVDDSELANRIYLINPYNFIATDEKTNPSKHFRIRVGASDADTSFMMSLTLALKLAEAGLDTDYELVWEQPHSEADYKGEVISWIESITK